MNKEQKKVINGWAMYDWANSVYNLVITTTFFPVYFLAQTGNKVTGSDQVSFFGWQLKNSSLYDYSVAFAFLLVAILTPILSSIADNRGNKKQFLRFFCYIGATACAALFFFNMESPAEYGVICFILATIGYCGGLVFYNAYLPDIAPVELRDRVSARGFSLGYIGSVILQLIGFALVALEPFGMKGEMPVLVTFLLVGIWWWAFAQFYTFPRLPKSEPIGNQDGNIFKDGFIELKKVYAQVRKLPVLKRFLRAFFFYSMGVQTVMLAATIFGSKELKLEDQKLIMTVVLIQLVAVLGAWGMARLSERFGNFKILILTVIFWAAVCVIAYFTYNEYQFYGLAVMVGLVMGGIQSLSRSTYSKLIPPTKDTTSFFSYFDVTEKIGIVLGMASFGVIDHMYNMRQAVLILIVYFAIGLIFLFSALLKESKLAVPNNR
ncbi:MFS transporter [Chitinophaga caeni]|uniref:MFS transporter n=2 Tax=Chitinophaga caeni TaxID=2029983 RepID=A0A291QT41_9BACT|nr:MFS transporter [Chitinophaga caeni]